MNGRIWTRIQTAWRLSPASILRVATYRILLKLGVYKRLLPTTPPIHGPFFDWPDETYTPGTPPTIDRAGWTADAEQIIHGRIRAFSNQWVSAGFPPKWHRSLLTGIEMAAPQVHWTLIPDFSLSGGDIKGYWELGRFDGFLILTLGWIASGREEFRQAMDKWLESWAADNAANAGIQWKCGQETGIRLMQLLLASELLRRWTGARTTTSFDALVAQHARRISRTMLYAIGQDNNHGTSEAAALFAAGTFLCRHGSQESNHAGNAWRKKGRRLLESRVARLIMSDGSFSQHSLNYHRVALDTVSFAETWRQWYDEPAFSREFIQRCSLATHWLGALTDEDTGDAPNLGANDGARLFVLHRLPYRDFRPSVQWAARLFEGSAFYPAGAWDETSAWLGLGAAAAPQGTAQSAALFRSGGYAKLSAGKSWLLLRLPHYQFRPSHSDGLHLDLWVGALNVLRDGGTYSYNTEEKWLNYFRGVESHNTVQFDGHDQMPLLSRFLFGRWLRCEEFTANLQDNTVTASYRNSFGNAHRREVRLEKGRCTVTDVISGLSKSATLRWRLAPLNWRSIERGVEMDGFKVELTSPNLPVDIQLSEGYESRHYGQINTIPVLEIKVNKATTLVTQLLWQDS